MFAGGEKRAYSLNHVCCACVRVGSGSLTGVRPPPTLKTVLADPAAAALRHADDDHNGGLGEPYVTCQLMADGVPLCLPMQTAYRAHAAGAPPAWNEWLVFPVKYRDLPASALAVFTVYDCGSVAGDVRAAG